MKFLRPGLQGRLTRGSHQSDSGGVEQTDDSTDAGGAAAAAADDRDENDMASSKLTHYWFR